MLSWKLSLSLVAVALLNFGCKSELAMPSGSNSIGNGNGSTLNPLTNPANASQILIGKEVYDSNGNVITGTLDTESLSPNSTAVPAGYYDSDDLRDIDTDLVSSNIRSGVTIFGVTGNSNVVNTSGTNATSGDMLSGKTAYVNGSLVTGSITTQSLSNNSTAVPAGYYSGTTLTEVDADLVSTNIRSGVTIFGVAGNSNVVNTSGTNATSGDMLSGKTAYVNGNLVTGGITIQSLSNNSTAVPAGYYSATNLTTVDADLVSANIKSGITIFGVAGDTNVINTQSATPATTSDVLSGKTAFVNGSTVTGAMANQGGLWDLGDLFPGPGYYSGINPSQTLSASKVCRGYQFLGSTTTAICQGTSVDSTNNASTEHVLRGKYFWNSLGNSVEGTMENKSNTWDLTTIFPGPGYYSGISPALTTSDVCKTKFLLANEGTAVCLGASGGTNATNANVLEGTYYWNDLGQSVQGIMKNHGTQDLRNGLPSPAAGYYSSFSNAPSDSSKICSGTQILGVLGTASCTTSFGDFISSMAPRADNATVDLSVPGSLNRSVATISQEVSGASQFTDNHRLVPDPRYDNDGRYGVALFTANATSGSNTLTNISPVLSSITDVRLRVGQSISGTGFPISSNILIQSINSGANTITLSANATTTGTSQSYAIGGRRHYLEMITGRPTNTCGTIHSIEERIADCAAQNGSSAFYDGKKYGQNGEGNWKLVTRTSGYEVWRDEQTKLIWSDRLSTTYNWCRAAGFAQLDSTLGYMTQECGVGWASSIQTTPPTSVCAEAQDLNGSSVNGISNYVTPSHSAEKGGLDYLSNPKVTWRLPTIHDWMVAEINGIRKVLPNMDYAFFSATAVTQSSGTGIINSSWAISGITGGVSGVSLSSTLSIRCVAH